MQAHKKTLIHAHRHAVHDFLTDANEVADFINFSLTSHQQYLNEANWSWRLMKTIMTLCHVYDKEQNYVSFEQLAPEESQPITFLKKVMPDHA